MEREVPIRISGTSTVTVVGLPVVEVAVIVTKMKLYPVDVVVVGTVKVIMGIWVQVYRNMAWYTRVVVVVEGGQ